LSGLIDLYQASFEENWLSLAIDLQQSMDQQFRDDAGGYFDGSKDDQNVVIRLKECKSPFSLIRLLIK
jgi:uncharacterized protein YyaL (SSP411 family)